MIPVELGSDKPSLIPQVTNKSKGKDYIGTKTRSVEDSHSGKYLRTVALIRASDAVGSQSGVGSKSPLARRCSCLIS